jgi:hypothetical protein
LDAVFVRNRPRNLDRERRKTSTTAEDQETPGRARGRGAERPTSSARVHCRFVCAGELADRDIPVAAERSSLPLPKRHEPRGLVSIYLVLPVGAAAALGLEERGSFRQADLLRSRCARRQRDVRLARKCTTHGTRAEIEECVLRPTSGESKGERKRTAKEENARGSEADCRFSVARGRTLRSWPRQS